MYVLFCASEDLKDAKYIRKGNKNLLLMKFGMYDTLAMCGKVVDCKKTKFGVMLTLNDGENFVVTAGTFNKNALQDASDVLQKFYGGNKEIFLLIYANPFYKEAIYLNANQDYSVLEVTRQIYEKFHELRKRGLTYLTEKFNEKGKKSEKQKEKEEISQEKKSNELTKSKEKASEKPMPVLEKTMIKEEISPVSSEILPAHLEISNERLEGVFEMSETEYKRQTEINLVIVKFVENLAKDRKDKSIGIEELVNELSKNENFPSLKDINVTDKIYELLEMGYFYEPRPGYIKVVQ